MNRYYLSETVAWVKGPMVSAILVELARHAQVSSETQARAKRALSGPEAIPVQGAGRRTSPGNEQPGRHLPHLEDRIESDGLPAGRQTDRDKNAVPVQQDDIKRWSTEA